jgi:hypothetical protein
LNGYEYIAMRWLGTSPSGKTGRWLVVSNSNLDELGTISWLGRWRQYTFQPMPLTVFSAGCLDDISSFLRMAKQVTDERLKHEVVRG